MLRISYTKHATNEEVLRILDKEHCLSMSNENANILVTSSDKICYNVSCMKERSKENAAEEDKELHGWMDNLKKWTGKSYGKLLRMAEDRKVFRCMTVNVLKALSTLG